MDVELALAATGAALEDLKQIASSMMEVGGWTLEVAQNYGQLGLTLSPSLINAQQSAYSLSYFLDEAMGECETLLLNLTAANEGG